MPILKPLIESYYMSYMINKIENYHSDETGGELFEEKKRNFENLFFKKIRIMHIIHQLGTGGAENGIVNLANGHNHNKFELSICTLVGGGSLTYRLDQSKTSLFELEKKEGNDISIILKLYSVFKKFKPDIVHTHAWGTLCESFLAAKLARIPIMIHGEHGTIQEKPINIFIQNIFWKMTSQVLSISSNHKKLLSETIKFPLAKITVIPNGVDIAKFSYMNNSSNRLIACNVKQKTITIGTIGRLVPVKNQQILIRVLAKLKKKFSDVELLIIGDGPLKSDLKKLSSRLSIADSVVMPGRKSDITKYFHKMDIFILPSFSEGMSNTILEAMSCGVPVIASDVGGNPELIDNGINGLLFPSQDQKKLEELIMQLIENPEIALKLSQNARQKIEHNFSIEKMVQNYEKMYFQLYYNTVKNKSVLPIQSNE